MWMNTSLPTSIVYQADNIDIEQSGTNPVVFNLSDTTISPNTYDYCSIVVD